MKRKYKNLFGNKHAKGNQPNKTSFRKGHKPWNKGVRGIHLSPKTEFKKGRISNRLKPVGVTTKRKDKNGIIRQWIKIQQPNKWIEYAKWVWISKNGEIPKGFLLHHIDKNTLNDDIANLTLLTRKGHINIHREELLEGRKNKRLVTSQQKYNLLEQTLPRTAH